MAVSVVRGVVDRSGVSSSSGSSGATAGSNQIAISQSQLVSAAAQSTQLASRQAAASEAVVSTLRASKSLESEKIKDFQEATEVADALNDLVRGSATVAKDAHGSLNSGSARSHFVS